jgi:hypothetical protein
MGYAVCHRDETGTLKVEDVASLDAAVEVVERLRNEDGASDVRVFREVPIEIEVRTYYKVSIADDESPAPVAVTTDLDAVPPAPAPAEPEVVDGPAPAASAGPVLPTAPLPGAFSLASTPVPQPAVEVHELDDAADGSRRSLFSRGG